MNRQDIYATLGVQELWRFDGQSLRVYKLREAGDCEPSSTSTAFPFLPVQKLVPFLQPDEQTDETTRLRSFVNWLREQDFALD